MAAPPLVFNIIGAVFTAITYGVYCTIFGLYWRIQLTRTERRKGGVLLYLPTASFILCTAYFIIDIIQVQFFITMSVLKEDSLGFASLWLTMANNALYIAIDFNSQLILLYRCWIMWQQPFVMVIPCILSLAFIVTSLSVLGIQIKDLTDNLPLPDQLSSATTAFFVLSLVVNALVTSLIVYKIITVYQYIRGITDNTSKVQAGIRGNGRRDLYPLISILIESGLITFVGQLTQPVLYNSASAEFPLVAGWVVMLYGISTTVVLVRVEMGVSYDQSTKTTAHYTSLGHPTQVHRPSRTIKFK